MAGTKFDAPPKAVTSIWPAVAVLAFAGVVCAVAQGYSETARRFPSIVALVLAVLAVFDIYGRTRLPGHDALNTFWGSGFSRREMTHDPGVRDEFAVLGWVVSAFAALAVLGILAGAPLFTLFYVWQRGGRPFAQAALIGLGVMAFEYGVFEWILDYELYRGLILAKGGLSAW